MPVLNRSVAADGLSIFYREAGDPAAPVVLLLHGFPTSSHMFRALIPRLAEDYHVVAPDLPGFGFSDAPPRDAFAYTFQQLTHVVDRFTEAIGLDRFALYVFDYGAPIGLRLALLHPERVTALISQNGNAYEEGLSDGWNPIQTYWSEPTPRNRTALRDFLTADSVRSQYLYGVADPRLVGPESFALDQLFLDRPGNADIQLDLFLDYASNVQLYPAFQAYFRTHRPPTLAVWGERDPFFLPAGAEAFRRDNPAAEVHLFPTGHFALETHAPEIARLIRGFLSRVLTPDIRKGHAPAAIAPAAIARFYAALRANDVEAWLATFAPDATSSDPVGTPPVTGHSSLRQFFDGLLAKFARFDGLTEDEVFVAGPGVAVRWTATGKSHAGQPVTFSGIDIFDFNAAGTIQTLHAYFDLPALGAQLALASAA